MSVYQLISRKMQLSLLLEGGGGQWPILYVPILLVPFRQGREGGKWEWTNVSFTAIFLDGFPKKKMMSAVRTIMSNLSILPDPDHDHSDDDDIQQYWWDDHVTQFPAQFYTLLSPTDYDELFCDKEDMYEFAIEEMHDTATEYNDATHWRYTFNHATQWS